MLKSLSLVAATACVAALSSVALAAPYAPTSAWRPSTATNVKAPMSSQHQVAQQAAIPAKSQNQNMQLSGFGQSPYGYARLDSVPGA